MSTVVFRSSFAEHLRFGHALEICAKAKEEAKRFHISLSNKDANSGENANIGLHMQVNFHKDMIIFKKHVNGEWCDEESKAFETSQFSKEFKIYIVMADEKFHISINKVLLGCYKYRLRLSLLTLLEIDGDLEYVRQVDHRKYFPYAWPPIQVVEERLQFSNDVPMQFKPGHVVVASLQLVGNDKGRFIVHLRNICDIERQELHLSVRFDTKTIVRTSKTIPDGDHYSFTEEEKVTEFPFEDFSKPFKLAFAFTANEVIIAKDGLSLCGFVFRTPNVLPLIGGLKMFGTNGADIRVSQIDHIQMEDVLCTGFESYSNLQCLNNEDTDDNEDDGDTEDNEVTEDNVDNENSE